MVHCDRCQLTHGQVWPTLLETYGLATIGIAFDTAICRVCRFFCEKVSGVSLREARFRCCGSCMTAPGVSPSRDNLIAAAAIFQRMAMTRENFEKCFL